MNSALLQYLHSLEVSLYQFQIEYIRKEQEYLFVNNIQIQPAHHDNLANARLLYEGVGFVLKYTGMATRKFVY